MDQLIKLIIKTFITHTLFHMSCVFYFKRKQQILQLCDIINDIEIFLRLHMCFLVTCFTGVNFDILITI